MKRYLVQKYSMGNWQGIHAEYLTDFASAYILMCAEALANPGVVYRIRAHGKTIGVPLMFTKQDLSQVVAADEYISSHERSEKVKP